MIGGEENQPTSAQDYFRKIKEQRECVLFSTMYILLQFTGGIGKYLADWMINGEPPFDLIECEPGRYGNWATREYVMEKCRETYGLNKEIMHPKLERWAGRPVRTSGIYKVGSKALIDVPQVSHLILFGSKCELSARPETRLAGQSTFCVYNRALVFVIPENTSLKINLHFCKS